MDLNAGEEILRNMDLTIKKSLQTLKLERKRRDYFQRVKNESDRELRLSLLSTNFVHQEQTEHLDRCDMSRQQTPIATLYSIAHCQK